MDLTLLVLAFALVVTGVALALQATGVADVTELLGALAGLITALTAKLKISKVRDKRRSKAAEGDDPAPETSGDT